MSHFAKVIDGIVAEVLVVERDVIDSGLFGDPALWVQTSYNTHGGQHPEGRPLRKNFAGIGFAYDADRDAFIPPQPFPSWLLNEDTCLWACPVPYPAGETLYAWDEETLSWVEPTPYDPVVAEPEAPVVVEPDPVVAEPEAPVVEAALSTVTSSVGSQ